MPKTKILLVLDEEIIKRLDAYLHARDGTREHGARMREMRAIFAEGIARRDGGGSIKRRRTKTILRRIKRNLAASLQHIDEVLQ